MTDDGTSDTMTKNRARNTFYPAFQFLKRALFFRPSERNNSSIRSEKGCYDEKTNKARQKRRTFHRIHDICTSLSISENGMGKEKRKQHKRKRINHFWASPTIYGGAFFPHSTVPLIFSERPILVRSDKEHFNLARDVPRPLPACVLGTHWFWNGPKRNRPSPNRAERKEKRRSDSVEVIWEFRPRWFHSRTSASLSLNKREAKHVTEMETHISEV